MDATEFLEAVNKAMGTRTDGDVSIEGTMTSDIQSSWIRGDRHARSLEREDGTVRFIFSNIRDKAHLQPIQWIVPLDNDGARKAAAVIADFLLTGKINKELT
jgi:hypothetical protein